MLVLVVFVVFVKGFGMVVGVKWFGVKKVVLMFVVLVVFVVFVKGLGIVVGVKWFGVKKIFFLVFGFVELVV